MSFPVLRQAPFIGRENLAVYCNEYGLTGLAVEVGTHRGDYASGFLLRWQGRKLYCVDPWKDNLPGYEEQAKTLWGGAKSRKEDRAAAETLLGQFPGRAKLLAMTSLEAAVKLMDETLDFVYIDGDHSKHAVLADLLAWWPLLCSGGLLAGHDVVCPGEVGGGWGQEIQPAIAEFARETVGIHNLWLVVEKDGLPWSYYMVKP